MSLVLIYVHYHIYSEYWRGLLLSTDFTGKNLRQCLDVIHRDIVSIWNIRNSSVGAFSHQAHQHSIDFFLLQYLASDDFKAKMTVLVDDLV